MTYQRRIDRNSPGCIVFLVDQSTSMKEQIAGDSQGRSKAAAVAEQLNSILYELISKCTKALNELPRPYFSVAAIGYGTDSMGNPVVGTCLPAPINREYLVTTTDVAQHTKRVEDRQRVDGSGQTTRYRFPVWIDPVAQGGTPMCSAMNVAGQLVRYWVDTHPDTFPPIVINLTDGESTDGDPAEWARRIRGLATSDGNTLLFNVTISAHDAEQVMFPSSAERITDPFGRAMFELSSPLPPLMAEFAKEAGFAVDTGARGFAMNANFQSVMTFLNIGTQVTQLLR